ncbi:MAG: RNA methyltransferase [Muribaculaceae bacterium]|nr:RNA methyltransferase [Muribaculaceae bacterium]
MDNKFEMVAKTFQGLEDVLRDELISLGAENVEMGRRMVSFEGDLAIMYKANLCCRTALRILKPIEKFTAHDPDELYDIVRDIPWEKYMSPSTTFSIDSTVNSEDFTHSKFVTYRVKDGIVDHFRDLTGERPSIRVTGADLMLNVHISDDRVTISIDSSGEPLSKRGYRVEQTEAPINEVLAAGIIMKTGWRGDCNFVDPMCGSGTFLIEAALIAANINPGIYRESFAFEKWSDFDKELFEEIYNDDSAERDFNYKIYGGDIDPEAVAIARKNIKSAKVEDMVELSCRPMSDWIDNPEAGILVMNPPYGARLRPDDMTALYKGIGTCLKKNFPGYHAWIIGMNDDDFANIGLKPSVKIPMLNGSLECSLREYVLFDGSYSDFRADGGKVSRHEEDEESRAPRKMRRLSDDEWKAETRRFGHSKERSSKDKKGAGSDRRFDKKNKPARSDRKRYDNDFAAESERRNYGGDRKFEDRREKNNYGGDRKFNDRREKKNYGGDRKFDDRRDKKNYGGDRNFTRKGRGPVSVKPQGPKISADNAYIISEVPMRSRKRRQNTEEED